MTEIIDREENSNHIHYNVDEIDSTFEEDVEVEAIETGKTITVNVVNESEEGDQDV